MLFILLMTCLNFFRNLNVSNLQMKELQEQLEEENYFSVSH